MLKCVCACQGAGVPWKCISQGAGHASCACITVCVFCLTHPYTQCIIQLSSAPTRMEGKGTQLMTYQYTSGGGGGGRVRWGFHS